TTNFKGNTTLGALQVTGGTTNVMAEATLGACEISGGVANFQSIVKSGYLYIGSATANLESGAHMTVGQLRFSEGSNTNSVFNVKGGSRLDLTGTNNDHSTGASFLLNHWAGTSKFNVLGGQVNALGAIMYTSWAGTSTTQVSGGTLNVKGISFLGQSDVNKGSVFLGTNADGTVSNELATGRINIGESGIAALKDGDSKLVLGHGTIGALADWATNTGGGSKKITVLSALGTTFDTQDVNDATIGHTITLNHDITNAGKIIKTGKGNLILNGSISNFTGGTEINGGTLTANHANALGNGDVTLNKGTLNATNKHLSNHKITINGGTVSNLAKSSTDTLKEVTLSATSQEIDNKTITIDNSFLQATTAGSVKIGLGNQIIMMGGSTVMLGASNSSNVVTIVLGQNNLTTAAMTMTSGDTLSFAGTWTLDLSQFTGAVEKTDYTFHIISLPNNSTLFNLTEFKGFTITGNDDFTVKDSTAVLNELKNTGTVTLSYKGGPTPVVPEPSTVTLTLVALTGLLLRRRRAN
ncbi:MAG: PEP-CTERM sorting domain-containing protein, partial [Akkermansia sp.]